MPKRLLRQDTFNRGLWVAGSKDNAPEGSLRKARGVHSIQTGSLRSRQNDESIFSIGGAHSLYRFGDVRFQGASTILYRNGVSLITGLSGARLAFVRMPPTASVADYLFIAGGGLARKIDSSGAVTNWGISPPADGMTAALGTQQTKSIDGFESAAGWTAVDCSLSDEGTIKLFDTNSMQMDITGGDTLATASKAITVDLTDFSGTPSPLEDFIELWVRIEEPDNVEYIDVQFDVSGGAFSTNMYHYRVFTQGNYTVANQSTAQALGVSDLSGIHGNERGFAIENFFESQFNNNRTLEQLGQTTASGAAALWTRLRIPKRVFSRGGSSTNDWSNVAAMRLVCKTNDRGGTTVYWDRARLIGSAGLQGNYKYHVTFRNSTTGTRSNANATATTIQNVERQPVSLASIPVSSDPQVNQREIWRTFGGGSLFFRCAVINDNTTTTFSDDVADYAGLNSLTGVDVLESTELPDDNDVPSATYLDAWGPHQGRMWWARDSVAGARGRVYYSPAGRAEAVQGFVDVTDDDDPTQKGLVWNGANWVFTEGKLYRIDGTTEPFIAREVFGVPGTMKPHTVRATPFGILYESYDGVRVFDGSKSVLVSPEPIQVLFRGEDSEQLDAFSGTVGEYINNEYFISDTNQTLAVNLLTGVWRDLGRGYSALYAEPDTGLLIGGSGSTVIVESENATSVSVSFDIETPSINFGRVPYLVEAVYVDVTTDDTLSVNLVRDEVEEALAAITSGTRQVQVYQIEKMARLLGLRCTASVSGQTIIHSIQLQVRDIPLALQVNGRRASQLERSFDIEGEIGDLNGPIIYRGLDNTLAVMSMYQVPEVRRLYLDMNPNGEQIVARLVFLNETVELPPMVDDHRRIFSHDINVDDRLVRLELIGDWTTATLFQAMLDVHIGET